MAVTSDRLLMNYEGKRRETVLPYILDTVRIRLHVYGGPRIIYTATVSKVNPT